MQAPSNSEEYRKWLNSPEGKAERANDDAVTDSLNNFMSERADNPAFGNKAAFERIQKMANVGLITGEEALHMADKESEGFFSSYHQRRLGEQFRDFT